MSTWMWLNICFGALFILAVVGVPLWMVITRPDTGPRPAPASPPPGRRRAASRGPSPQARRAGPRPGGRSAAAGRCQLAALPWRGASTGRAAAGRSPAASS